ncbi:MAG: polysaccharide ABC transporter ATP-binding protein [Thermoanaerobaculia bacterium]
MTSPVIRADVLSKRYQLGVISHQSLRKELQSRWARFRGKDDPNSCVVDGRREGSVDPDVLWALRGVSFDVQQGDVVGIIGRNGAGKSTLLKILSRVTTPTEGVVRLKGHAASLLEVGTGFHPELTGRENVFLNGAILGMRRAEIQRKLDEIVAFAEVEKFVDTPVKRYSSGMYVRLAFAVAAHLEPEILIVDEVLAVGDIQFQRKCLGKMESVARAGRTVLFVSHNLGAVRDLCSRALLFEQGRLLLDGEVEEGLSRYENAYAARLDVSVDARFSGPLAGTVGIERIRSVQGEEAASVLDPLSPFRIEIHGLARRPLAMLEIKLAVFHDGLHVASCFDAPRSSAVAVGRFVSTFEIPANVFLPGRYTLGVGAMASVGAWMWGTDVATLEFADRVRDAAHDRKRGVLAIPYSVRRTIPAEGRQ